MKITKLETIELSEYPTLLWVRIHTADGLIGLGETYYTRQTTAQFMHEVAAKFLLGQDAQDIERHWRRIYDATHYFGNRGLEMRALSALDIAMWDLKGQACGLPIYQLLGGASRSSIRIYNTCTSERYCRGTPLSTAFFTTEIPAGKNEHDDLVAWQRDPVGLAKNLLAEGITAMKFWPLDRIAEKNGGQMISHRDLAKGLEPIERIRDAVGLEMDILFEGHGFWSLPAAIEIAHALEPLKIYWIEDLVRADNAGSLARLAASTHIPVCASEYLLTRFEIRDLLQQNAVGVVNQDPIWGGGISEGKKVAAMAEAYNVPVVFHDCTGPVGLWACTHLAIHLPQVPIQETVRAYYRGFYHDLVTEVPTIVGGELFASDTPGIGTALRPEVLQRADLTLRESTL